MGHRINDLFLNDRSSDDDQIGSADSRSDYLQMNFRDDRRNQLHFTSLRMSRNSNADGNQSSKAMGINQSKYFNLNDILNDLDFKSDLQSRSFIANQIIDDRILDKYKKILHHYNRKYGLSNSLSVKRPFSSSPTLSPLKSSNQNKEIRLKPRRTGLRKYNEKDSYYHNFNWIRWVAVTAFIFVISASGMYYYHVRDQSRPVASGSKKQSVDHHESSKAISVNHSLSIKQKKQAILLVNDLYGRINFLINNDSQENVAQLQFSSTPLSSLFVNGINNRDFQILNDRCVHLKNQNDGHRMKIKGISPVIKSVSSNHKHLIKVNLNSRIGFLTNYKHHALRIRDIKGIQLKLFRYKNRYQIIENNAGLLG